MDYAILSVQPASDTKRICPKADLEKLAEYTDVAAIGYPELSYRHHLDQPGDSDGDSQYLSLGKNIPAQGFCVIRDEQSPKLNGPFYPHSLKITGPKNAESIRQGDLLQTDLDIIPGYSGAPLIKVSTGLMVGIARSIAFGGSDLECRGAAFFTTIAGIRRSIQNQYPNLDVDSMFRCIDKAVSR